MKAIKTKLGKGGRINIPATFRQKLHINIGDDIILHMQDNLIYLTTAEKALHELQTKVKKYFNSTGKKISLADDLIRHRRKEATSE